MNTGESVLSSRLLRQLLVFAAVLLQVLDQFWDVELVLVRDVREYPVVEEFRELDSLGYGRFVVRQGHVDDLVSERIVLGLVVGQPLEIRRAHELLLVLEMLVRVLDALVQRVSEHFPPVLLVLVPEQRLVEVVAEGDELFVLLVDEWNPRVEFGVPDYEL